MTKSVYAAGRMMLATILLVKTIFLFNGIIAEPNDKVPICCGTEGACYDLSGEENFLVRRKKCRTQ